MLKWHAEEIGAKIPNFVAVHAYNTLISHSKESWNRVAATVEHHILAQQA